MQTNRSQPGGGANWRRHMFEDLRAHNERRMRRLRLRAAERRRRIEREMQIASRHRSGAGG
ncbi:MAG: hypothetical protein ACRDLV_02515 [Solirubrobacteraceae bacterium]